MSDPFLLTQLPFLLSSVCKISVCVQLFYITILCVLNVFNESVLAVNLPSSQYNVQSLEEVE